MASARSTRRGSDYLAGDQELNIGFCKDHARSNEAYCEECRIVICPSCLMFGSHQGHKVLSPGQAARLIREKIDKANKSGKLGPDYAERFLLDIRDSRIKVQKAKTTVTNQVEETFKSIIRTLKQRRNEIEDLIHQHFNQEFQTIDNDEHTWEEKQLLGKKLLEFSNSPADEALLTSSHIILSAIDVLNEQMQFKSLNLLTSIDFTVKHEENDIGFADLMAALEKVGTFGDIKKIQFRS
jgi:B-box zinc finger